MVGFPSGPAARQGSAPLPRSSGPQEDVSVLSVGAGPAQRVLGQTYAERVSSDRERHHSLSALTTGSFHPRSLKELARGVQPQETAAVPPAPLQPSPLPAGESPILTSHHRQCGSTSCNSHTSAQFPHTLTCLSAHPSNPKVPSATHRPELGHPPPPVWAAAKIPSGHTHRPLGSIYVRHQSSGAEGRSHSEWHPPPRLVSQEAV